MANLCSGILHATGKKSDLIRFATNACHAVVSEDGNSVTINRSQHVTGTRGGFVCSNGHIRFCEANGTSIIDEKSKLSFHFEQNWDIRASDLKKLSQMYNIDFDISAYEPGMDFNRYIKIVNGKILYNEYRTKNESFAAVKNQGPQFQQSDSVRTAEPLVNPVLTPGKFIAKSAYATLKELQNSIIKAVSANQKVRYISKCPCCGHEDMFSKNGKTYALPSSKADIYICRYCISTEYVEQREKERIKEDPDVPEDESMYLFKQSLPLSQWAVFNPEYADAFLVTDEIQQSDNYNVDYDLNCVLPV